jgi:outer membrane lipoprotein-sorting protein
MYQKGHDKRLTKFTAPADQKGIGFLSLPNDVMYLYLPAFNRTRRIASHVKNTKFAGTDFTYEDMEAKRDADKWNGTLKEENRTHWVIEMSLKPGKTSDYSRIIKWIRKDNYFPEKMEMYDKAGNLQKVLTREQIEKIDGFWTCRQYEMKDVKEDHSTRMMLMNIKFNKGMSDDVFTERSLAR